MIDKIVLPDEANVLQGSMADGIELPFPVCYFYVKNGSPQAKKEGGVAYFGGWSVDKDSFDALFNDVPSAFAQEDMTNREGGEYSVYSTRNLLIAPFAKRERWVEGRSHIQVLSLVSVVEKNTVAFLGTHVLTAKGYQTQKLKNAMTDWERATSKLRNDIAPGVDARYFWANVGTFGDEPTYQDVGKSATSKITPIIAMIPPDLNGDKLAKRYVGAENVKLMAELYQQASEWLQEWDKRKADAEPVLDHDYSEYFEDAPPEPEGPYNYDDVPF